MTTTVSVALITCYFGELPWYFPYFVKSCTYNPDIDFYIITDNDSANYSLPQNIKLVPATLQDFREQASAAIGFDVCVDTAYKICDFKPAFGEIFSDVLTGYDFWGHCDIDLIFGNIRAFMTDELLRSHDVISCRHDYITGSFALFKNTPAISQLYRLSRDYKKVFTEKENYCFDECNYLFGQLEEGYSIFDFPDHIQSMTYVVQKQQQEAGLRAHFDLIIVEGIPGDITWERGKLTFRDMFEAMYYHLVVFKVFCEPHEVPAFIPDRFTITEKKILH
jgi:hypothetical protein